MWAMWNGKYLWSWLRRDQEHRWSKAGSGRESAPALAAPKLRDDLGVVPGTGAVSFQNNKFLPELFQTDHNQARPAGNEADTACDIVTCLNFILGTIKFIAWARIPIICDVNTSGDNKDTQLHSDRGMAHMMSKLDDITQA